MNGFRSTLGQFLARWRFGLLFAGTLRAAFWCGVLFIALGFLDYQSGFGDAMRRYAFIGLIAVAVAGMIWAIVDAISFMRRDAAIAADAASGNDRRSVLSALEFEREPARSPLEQWLREQAVESAAESMGTFPMKQSFPVAALRRAALKLLGAVAIVGAAYLASPIAFTTVAKRLLDPKADIPPYSPLSFAVSLQPAEVLYGGETVATVEIAGGVPEVPVRCLTRDPATGVVEESAAFQENSGKYSRKLEKMATSVDVAFAVGRARSAWTPVQVKMQPRIQEVIVTIEPPAYSRQLRREFVLGSQDFTALPGSRITTRVTSNRPLGGGSMRLQTLGRNKGEQEVVGEREDAHRARFTWISRGGTLAELKVRDVLGTPSEAVKFEQKLLPDERPDVVLHRPSGEVLATPETELPIEGRAIDDLGLTRIAMVRKLSGYRERSRGEIVQEGDRRHDLTGKLNLAAFGVVPGQTIELSLEAGDTNPNLLGVGVSDTAKIRIISTEQYAAMLRNQTSLEEFAERYEALREAMEEARKSLKELEEAAKSGDPKKAEEARQKAYDAHKKAAEIFGKIAKDFQIFDLDGPLAKAAGEVAQQLGENGRDLEQLKGASPQELADAVKELMERMAEAEQKAAPEMEKGKRALAAAKVMDQAGKFNELLQEQRELVKELNRAEERSRRGDTSAAQALADLGKKQSEIEKDLRKMETEMESALRDLPEEFSRMKEEGARFLDMFDALEIPPSMADAAKAAEQANSSGAAGKAREALEKMEALLRKKNGICQMCRGEGEEPFPWPEDLSSTMQQLMQGLLRRPGGSGDGNQPGQSSGTGSGGASESSDSGYSMKGKMPRLPTYGPPRARFSKKAGASLGGGNGTGDGKGKPGDGAAVEGGSLAGSMPDRKAGESAAPELVPEAYREAVKRYFSAGSESPATNGSNSAKP